MAPRCPDGVVKKPASPAITSVFVTRVPTRPGLPVRGMLIPFNAGLLRTLSGVSPCATCQTMSPRFKSIAVIRPHGGFTMGRPITVKAPPPSPPRSTVGRWGDSPVDEDGRTWPSTQSMSDLPTGGLTSPMGPISVFEYTYRMPVSGSSEPPGQFAPPVVEGSMSVASGPSDLLTTAGVNIGPILYRDDCLTAAAFKSGVKSMRSSNETP